MGNLSRFRLFGLFLCAFLAASAVSQAQDSAPRIVGKVIAVTDGDTIKVLAPDNTPVRIRLNGIDCPESKQAFGTQAKKFTSTQCFGKTVTVIVRDHDKYGRTVGDVILPNGRNLNQDLVRAGYAWWYKEYAPKDRVLQRLQLEATIQKRGLWDGSAPPIPPWEFRHSKSSKSGETPEANRAPPITRQVPVQQSAPSKPSPQPYQQPTYTQPQTQSQQSTSSDTVYITNTGKKYHRAGCRYLAKSQIPISLSDAKARGYQPCSVCRP